jgi:hypothetical protein
LGISHTPISLTLFAKAGTGKFSFEQLLNKAMIEKTTIISEIITLYFISKKISYFKDRS